MTTDGFVERLLALETPVRMREVFELAKAHIALPVSELELVLEHPVHRVRVGALSTMDKQARRKRTPPEQRQALYDLYLRRLDRIDNWDLVDLGAPHVIGGHLATRDRAPLYELARSDNPWARRTAIVATLFLVRQDEVDDTFALAEILGSDPEHYVQTALGGLLREAGKRDRTRLLAFLEAHAATLPRITLRFASEHLDPATRAHLRSSRA
jgi:3-methyladenine DNA glycosylase AlkD